MKKKSVALLMALVLVVGGVIGGTIAWLMDTTETVTNTFTVGDVVVALDETKVENGAATSEKTTSGNTYQVVPGTSYLKDPKVSVAGTNVDCWLFVEFTETPDAQTYFNYTSTLTTENEWTQGDGTDIPSNVWYREVDANASVKEWYLLEGNNEYANGFIEVDGDAVTEDTMDAAKTQSISWKAYVAQKDNLTAEEAWAEF